MAVPFEIETRNDADIYIQKCADTDLRNALILALYIVQFSNFYMTLFSRSLYVSKMVKFPILKHYFILINYYDPLIRDSYLILKRVFKTHEY